MAAMAEPAALTSQGWVAALSLAGLGATWLCSSGSRGGRAGGGESGGGGGGSRGARTVRFGPGDSTAQFGEGDSCGLQPLRSSAEAFEAGDRQRLRANFEADGYIFLPRALDRKKVLEAKRHVLEDFAARGGVLAADRPLSEAVLEEGCAAGCVPFVEGRNELTHSPSMLAVLEGSGIRAAVQALLGVEEVRTFDFKWLRAVASDQFSGAHVDWVYMGHGSPQLITCWIPIGDIPVEMGTLAVCEGSHRLPSFAPLRQTYGKLDWEKDHLDGSGWFTDVRCPLPPVPCPPSPRRDESSRRACAGPGGDHKFVRRPVAHGRLSRWRHLAVWHEARPHVHNQHDRARAAFLRRALAAGGGPD